MNVGVYATFTELKEYLMGEKNANFLPKDDNRLKQFCLQMSRKFDAECNRQFYPVKETRYFDFPGGRYGYLKGTDGSQALYPNLGVSYKWVNELCLDDDLLEVVTFTTNNGETVIVSSDYYPMTGDSYNYPPYDKLVLKTSGTQTVLLFTGTSQKSQSVLGYWGYHEDWSSAWATVDTVENNPLTSSGTSITVNDVDGPDEYGLEPRFKVQQLLKLGTTNPEYVFVNAAYVDSNTLTVVRGVNGTTAQEWVQNTPIAVFRPQDDIRNALLVLGAWAYRRKDTVGTDTDRPLASDTGVLIMPNYLPSEVKSALSKYKRSPR